MRTKTTLLQLLYKSRLFGQNERRQLRFRILLPEKKKGGKARCSYDKMLILTELGKIFGPRSWRTDLAAIGPYAMTLNGLALEI